MRRIFVNALSVTNQSGQHVLLGHLQGLVTALADTCRFRVLLRPGMAAFPAALGDRVDWVHAPEATRRLLFRGLWEANNLALLVRLFGADAYFTPNGIAARGLSVPQVVFCQNPWALVPSARRRRDAPKAWLQRRAYRRAMRVAAVMVFNSEYMRSVCRRNAGFAERRGLVAYQAADDETRARAAGVRVPRVPGRLLCVSAMGPHKNVETVIRALALLVHRDRLPAHLRVIGSWPDPAYSARIRGLVAEHRLADRVVFEGFVPREQLDRHYAEAQAFCLTSRCESFGIPAVEAQLFGTPVVTSNACAIPEVCGEGGQYFDPDDAGGVAGALGRLLRDPEEWRRQSEAALANSTRFTWSSCTRPLIDLFRGEIPHG